MIAVGIPSFNEADNIVQLVTAIDTAASSLNMNIILINADNDSPDLTAECFREVETRAEKVSLITNQKGKGYNLKSIINYIATREDITYCLFVDGDIISFETEWLIKHSASKEKNYDYVIPNYSRNMQEGNTTNHFIYPELFWLTSGKAPYQGIAGDFGISKKFANHLSKQVWPESSLGYGVDIFMTLQALFSDMRITEISLNRKIHKPSFDKMVGMFQQVAESYFETRNRLSLTNGTNFDRQYGNKLTLLTGEIILADKLNERRNTALELYEVNEVNGLHICDLPDNNDLGLTEWVEILASHEIHRRDYAPSELALSLTPFYLLRVITYLSTTKSPVSAVNQINQTAKLLKKRLKGKS